VPATLVPEHRQSSGDAVERSAQIGIDHGVPCIDVESADRRNAGQPGIAHKNVESTELLGGRLHERHEVSSSREVSLHGERSRAGTA